MILSGADFNAHLAHMGQDVMWRRGFACPCINPKSGAADMDCPQCLGKGRIWTDAVASLIGVSGRDVQRSWQNFGIYEDGDQVVVIGSDQPAYAIGAYDRVLSLNRSEPFSINLTRGVNERIAFPVLDIDRVLFFQGRDLTTLLDGDLPIIGSDGDVIWQGDAPPDAATYSITGRRRSEFFVFREMPFDRPHHQGEPLPRRVVLRRFDLFGR